MVIKEKNLYFVFLLNVVSCIIDWMVFIVWGLKDGEMCRLWYVGLLRKFGRLEASG